MGSGRSVMRSRPGILSISPLAWLRRDSSTTSLAGESVLAPCCRHSLGKSHAADVGRTPHRKCIRKYISQHLSSRQADRDRSIRNSVEVPARFLPSRVYGDFHWSVKSGYAWRDSRERCGGQFGRRASGSWRASPFDCCHKSAHIRPGLAASSRNLEILFFSSRARTRGAFCWMKRRGSKFRQRV